MRLGPLTFAIAAAFLPAPAPAQEYPSRPVLFVVPYAPGGGTETMARLLGRRLEQRLGKPFVIDNRPGAGTAIGATFVAKSAPDGHTILLATSTTLAINVSIYRSLAYDPLKDLVPISMAAVFANVLVVQPALPVKNIGDYVKYAKQKPGVTYASSGIGGAGHLAGELLKKVAQIDIVHVPYKGGGPAMQGFLGGQVDSFFATPISTASQIRSGKARAIATTGAKRDPLMPDVPTVAEAGYPGYEALNWYGYLAPAKTPKEVVERLHRDIAKALANPKVVEGLRKTGVEPVAMTPDEFGRYIKREYDTWGKVVKQAGIKAQ